MSDSEDHIDSPEGGDDLFGDGENSDQEQPLSDHGLDSDQLESPRAEDEREDAEREVKTEMVMGVHMFRHRTPKPKDGTVCVEVPAPHRDVKI